MTQAFGFALISIQKSFQNFFCIVLIAQALFPRHLTKVQIFKTIPLPLLLSLKACFVSFEALLLGIDQKHIYTFLQLNCHTDAANLFGCSYVLN